jgi:hypothetical protein
MANSYLARTVTSAESPTKITWSVWVKRCELARTQRIVSSSLSNYQTYWRFSSSDQLNIWTQDGSGNAAFGFNTNRQFRDTNAWYNIVMSVDTTQSTESDRLKIWVNGVQETSFSQSDYPSQNETIGLFGSTSSVVEIGRYSGNTTEFYNGYLSHLVITPGYAYANTDFGSFDSTSGIWKFKSPTLANWGTNGVHLKFENSGNLGLDSSGNSNNYSVNGNLKQALDTPSNVHATLNPLHRLHDYTLTEGNNTFTNSSTGHRATNSTLAVNTGKWYAEVKVIAQDSSATYPQIGIIDPEKFLYSTYLGNDSRGYAYLSNGNTQYDGNVVSSWGASYTVGDIIGIAMDLTNNKIYFSKNGTFQASGNPASGATGTGSAYTIASGVYYTFAQSSYDGSQNPVYSWNFGNGYFGTTAISSAGSNGNGSLFEYDVPSGYYALNTKNINTYG